MSDEYSSKEIWLFITFIYIISLVISIIYLLYYIDRHQISFLILIICIIYSSLFIFLNIIVIFDLIYNNEDGFEKLFNIITNFYLIFSLATKVLGLVIFTLWINYLESGYYKIYKRLLDIVFRYYNKIKKIKTWKIILISIATVILFAVFLTLFIIFKDNLGLENPIYYINIFVDMYAIVNIYINVGFFIVQSIMDYKRQRNEKLTKRFYKYSKMKIINETKKYFAKIKKIYKEMNNDTRIYENTSPYGRFLQALFKDVKEKMKLYELFGDNITNNKAHNDNVNNNVINNNVNNKIHNNNIINNLNIHKDTNFNDTNINNNINETNINFNNFFEKPKKEIPINIISSTNINSQKENNQETPNNHPENKKEQIKKSKEYMSEKNLEEYYQKFIREYKKSLRKINKMKKLNIDIEAEKQIPFYNSNKLCFYIKYFIIFIAFAMVIITDFLLPITYGENMTSKKDIIGKDDKEGNMLSLAIGLVILIPIYILCSSYTVILVYSTTRRRYITGDFLSGKQVNDNLSLMKTVKLICGYSFAVIYCNLYFWKTVDREGNFGSPRFYEKIIIPDYEIKHGISLYMITKLILIIVSIILNLILNEVSLFKNDLAEFNLKYTRNNFDDTKLENDFDIFLKQNNKINKFLEK